MKINNKENAKFVSFYTRIGVRAIQNAIISKFLET